MSSIVDQIDALLPQTQCGECDYAACRPYAEAIANQEADINHCPPGGVETLMALSELLNRDPTPFLDDVKANTRPAQVVSIREAECIGCTKCIQACPVDAILGSSKHMHTVITAECTGCELCVAPCPVDCIDLVSIDEPAYDRDTAKQRYDNRQARLENNKRLKQQKHRVATHLSQASDAQDEMAARLSYIQNAVARVKEKKRDSA